MSRTRLGRAAIASLTLGTATVACNPGGGHVASIGQTPAAAGEDMAAKARAALARRDARDAIRLAERAVAAAPADADARFLLGQSYLAAGRFASAETSLRESLSLDAARPRAAFDLALAEIAQGRGAGARATLAGLGGQVADADLGLATALSGDREGAIALLSDCVRAGKSDARARQNLALAFALDGRWREARGMAMQDTGPDRIDDRIAGWARLVASDARAQVAAMLGAPAIAADPGRPAALALATPAPAPVALAAAEPAPVPVAPAPVAPVVQVSAAPPAAAAAPPVEALAVPVLLAAREPSLVRVAPGPLLRPAAQGRWVVQLGAFSREGALETAWSRVARLSPRIATFSPVSGRTSVSGATLVRLSVGGFGERQAAAGLCRQIRVRGGACFVRSVGNDTPWQWAGAEGASRLALAETRAGA